MKKLGLRVRNSDAKNIPYGDIFAQFFLWQKALQMSPIWAIPLIPLLGLVCRIIGPVATQIGYGLVVVLCINYFFEDLLKRRIRLDDDYLYLGFRTVPIREILSINVTYKKNKFLPANLLLSTKSGKTLKLALSGLTEEGVESLVRHLQARNSNLNTTAVLSTLVKCRRAPIRALVDTNERLVIPYSSRKLIDESVDTFLLTGRKWLRLGPVLVSVAAAPIWMSSLSGLYVCLQPNVFEQLQSLNLQSFVGKVISAVNHYLMDLLKQAATAGEAFAANWLVITISTVSLVAFFVYLQSLFLRPTELVADEKGISLLIKLGQISIPIGFVAWSDVKRAELYKPSPTASSESWKIRLTKSNGQNFDLALNYLADEDRVRLRKRLETRIANCEIDSELSQALLAKSERNYTEIWLQSLIQSPERKTLEPLGPGQIVGSDRFEILRTLGVGGQGTAYLCRDLESKNTSTVVLKETILPVFVEDSVRRNALERFENEAKILQSLKSDRIVKLLDYFIEDHRAYLLLEHIDGETLRELIQRDGALAEVQAHDLALQMCEILETLHESKIVHRDFTPDNLILSSTGKLKLIDFNVAQQIQSGSTGTVVGKHAYLPPEQFRGKATSQSDLYAFGATLFYLLTGKDPEPISQCNPGDTVEVSKDISEVVKHATALQANKRYVSAQEIERDLLAYEPTELVSSGVASKTKLRSNEQVVEHG